MTHPPDSTISVSVPAGADRTHAVGMIRAVLTAQKHALGGEHALGFEPARKPRKPRRPPLDSLLKQAAKAGKSVKGAEVYQDRTVLQFGEPESAAPENEWPLDEFRTKETK